MKFGFSMVFFAVWPGGRRCANCRDAHFLRGTVMKASSHEKHSKQQWKKQKKQKFRPMGKVWGEAWQGTWV